MVYRKEHAIEAWKTFVSTGTILEDKVRPEIARSWLRCRAAGVNPWSSDFAEQNLALLEEKRQRFAASLKSTVPVMKFLKEMLGCNVSLMDGENFVFELLSPLAVYPRTFGTFTREEEVGTGNATLVAYEKKPVRVDGFEHYRAIVQTYSGVSVPYLDAAGKYYGAMNINSPFAVLPQSALELCRIGVSLTNDLHRAGAKAGALLSTVDFFKPLMLAYEHPVLLIDPNGRILGGNAGMRAYCPGWEQYSYGSQSLGAYLGKDFSVQDVLDLPDKLEAPLPIRFKKGRSRAVHELNLVRHGKVEVEGQEPFVMLVFEDGNEAERNARSATGRRSDAAVMPTGDKVDYIGETEEWKKIDRMVQKVAPIKTNVLLLGETGTGKEVVARALHRRSGRTGEFVAINCGALPRDLLATELFGYEGGAFTGARETGAVGKFEFADGGTLFLDEIGEMPVDMQVSLLRVLQEQINPHFLYNTLDNIIWLAESKDTEQVVRMVSSLSSFFRTTLSKGREFITVKEEEQHIRSYLEIQQFRYRDILEYEIAIPEELYEYEIIKLTLQPLVENALYHGIKNKRGGGHIRVSGVLCQDVMIFKVQDDGIGMDGARLAQVCAMLRDGEQEPEQEETGGFGLFNVNQRIQLNYGREYGLKIQSTYGQGTEIWVRIPCRAEKIKRKRNISKKLHL